MKEKFFLSMFMISLLLISNVANVRADNPGPLLVHLQGAVVPTNLLFSSGHFGVLLNSGGSAYSYSLDLPPGTHNLQPEVSLSYTNQQPKTQQSFLGTGWDLSSMYIQRDVKNSFADSTDDAFALVSNGARYSLVYNASTDTYHTNPENFFNIQQINESNNEKGTSWIIRTQDGTTYNLGSTNNSEQVSNLYSYVVRWSLDKTTDTFNNSIFYNYTENPYTNDNGTVYPDTISYNNDLKRTVKFVYESSTRPDINVYGVFEEGNQIKYARRLVKIQVLEDANLVTEYTLGYSPLDSYALSFITNITKTGSDNSTLAPVKFSYKKAEPGFDSIGLTLPRSISNIENGVRFGDLNRDGLIDEIRSDCNSNNPIQDCTDIGLNNVDYNRDINTGSSFVSPSASSWNYTHYFSEGGGTGIHLDSGARLVDINGDGFDDILYSHASRNQEVWINNGTNWNQNTSWHIPVNFSDGNYQEYEDMASQLIDLNGDGLVDITYGKEIISVKRTYLNNGTGWVRNTAWDPPRYIVRETSNLNNTDGEIRFTDINGDGLPDILATQNDQMWLNTGNGWLEYSGYSIPSFWDFFLGIAGTYKGDGGHRLADVDGDGLIDILSYKQNYQSPSSKARLSTGQGWTLNDSWALPGGQDYFTTSLGRDNAVRFVDINGDGAVDYLKVNSIRLNKAAGAYQMIAIQDEKGGITSISYMPSTQFDNTGDDDISDLGFNLWVVANITKDNNMSGAHSFKAITYYNYSDGLYDYADKEFRGFGHVTETTADKQVQHWFHQDDGKKYKEYRTNISDANGVLYQSVEQTWNATNKGGYYEVFLAESSTASYDGQVSVPRISNVSYQYDSFGNTILVHDKGEASNANDDTYQYVNYLANSSAWIVNKAKNSSVYASDGTTKLRETLYRYDGLSDGAVPTKGALTREEQWLNGGTNPVITYTYDAFGNVANTTDANNHSKQNIYGIRDSTHTFADKVVDGTGNSIDYTYKLGTGKKLSEVDSNGFMTNYTYDGLGRVIAEIQPYDTTSYPTKTYDYESNGIAPESVKTSSRETAGTNNTLDEYTFSDGLGNIIQTKKEGENSTQLVVNTYYDLSGRTSKKSNVYNISFFANYSTPDTSIGFTNYTYDALDRTIKVVNPDGTSNNATYLYWNVTFYDEKGNRLDHAMNAHGKIIEVKEYNANQVYTTRYFYNGNNELTGIIDNANNVWNYTYDTLGRKTVGTDPDTGVSNYTYDAAGNLIKQTSGGGNMVTGDGYYREYDSFGRLSTLRTGNNVTAPVLEIYTYDGNGDRIKTYNNATNTTTYTPFKEFTMIVNSSGQYNYTYIYDDSDTLVARINPDASVWYYHADHKGSTALITNQTGGVVENTIYEPFGAIASGGNAEDKLYEGKVIDNPCQYQFGARYYNPCTALFTQPDSLIPGVYDPQQLNVYAFERNNPYIYVDESGHVVNIPIALGAGLIVGGIMGGITYYETRDLGKAITSGAIAGAATALSVATFGATTIAATAGGTGARVIAPTLINELTGATALVGIGFTESIANQVFVEGKKNRDISYGEATLSGALNVIPLDKFGLPGTITRAPGQFYPSSLSKSLLTEIVSQATLSGYGETAGYGITQTYNHLSSIQQQTSPNNSLFSRVKNFFGGLFNR